MVVRVFQFVVVRDPIVDFVPFRVWREVLAVLLPEVRPQAPFVPV